MTATVLVSVYALGWILAIRTALQRRMLREVCDRCGYATCWCSPYRSTARGAMFDRRGVDVAAAMWVALVWPLWCLAVLARYVGCAVTSTVDRATPLTIPELQRRVRDRDAEIQRLTANILRSK